MRLLAQPTLHQSPVPFRLTVSTDTREKIIRFEIYLLSSSLMNTRAVGGNRLNACLDSLHQYESAEEKEIK